MRRTRRRTAKWALTLALATVCAGVANGQSATTHKSASSGTAKKSTSGSSSKKKSSKRTKKVKGQAAPTPERIGEIQAALAKNGTYAGEPSGKMDEATVDALRKFQSGHGLSATGKLDAPTLQKLGLGSETAGVAAPNVPANTANRLLTRRTPVEEPGPEN